MSQGQIEARKKFILGDKKIKYNLRSNGTWLHQRGYDKGDIRCIRCKKWINPTKPEEAEEIGYFPSGKRYHKGCPFVFRGGAVFATCPRHSPSRRAKVKNAKRY